mmetsp:Transcript_31867/g.63105  ORF Transcript_31867/g.63105 Transcript_31867/m.63105 type:complete len:107 (+) Transcript_31867:159-479(+)
MLWKRAVFEYEMKMFLYPGLHLQRQPLVHRLADPPCACRSADPDDPHLRCLCIRRDTVGPPADEFKATVPRSTVVSFVSIGDDIPEKEALQEGARNWTRLPQNYKD